MHYTISFVLGVLFWTPFTNLRPSKRLGSGGTQQTPVARMSRCERAKGRTLTSAILWGLPPLRNLRSAVHVKPKLEDVLKGSSINFELLLLLAGPCSSQTPKSSN
ncbi:hypothetical protein F4678DRAFT_197435 [Xylaria arbuscula]|nr:hypothetical protein F4678DRAFT_197435 [Xylaria arbuscula]